MTIDELVAGRDREVELICKIISKHMELVGAAMPYAPEAYRMLAREIVAAVCPPIDWPENE